MPIPKNKQDLYGKIVGHFINQGKSPEEAKAIAEHAILGHEPKKKKHKKKS